jgi:hypothetical protein
LVEWQRFEEAIAWFERAAKDAPASMCAIVAAAIERAGAALRAASASAQH